MLRPLLFTPSNFTRPQNEGTVPIAVEKQSFGNLEVSFNNEAIKYIEDIRKDSDPQFTFNIIYRFQKVITQSPSHTVINSGDVQVGPIRWLETAPFFTVPRSEWIKLLKMMKYSEVEIFEVNKLVFKNDENLNQAFEYLKEAESQLRLGNYDGVLVDCKLAFESAAKYAANGKTKQGFDLILENVFPDIVKKQTPFNDFIQSISNYSQLGRHADYPHLPIDRDEAEFIYIATLNVFSFISRRFKPY